MLPRRIISLAFGAAAVAAALPGLAQPLPSREVLTAALAEYATSVFAPCELTGPPLDVDLIGPTVYFGGDSYSDAEIACIADVSQEQGWEVTFRTPELSDRFSRIEMQRPHMQRFVAEDRERARERLRRSGHLARLPSHAPGDDLGALAPRIEALCGFSRGQVLQVNQGRMVMGAAPPGDPRTACLFDALQVLDIEFTHVFIVRSEEPSADPASTP